MRLAPEKTDVPIHERKIKSGGQEFYNYMKVLLIQLQESLHEIRRVVNYNQDYIKPRELEQYAVPDPKNNEIVVWKDSDASAGDPTHYLVWKSADGTIRTFGSEETV